jgi:hypothetical protein
MSKLPARIPVRLSSVTLVTTQAPRLTGDMFPGCCRWADTGETYLQEWSAWAEARPLNLKVKIIWRFPVTKGAEPDARTLPWAEATCVHSIIGLPKAFMPDSRTLH